MPQSASQYLENSIYGIDSPMNLYFFLWTIVWWFFISKKSGLLYFYKWFLQLFGEKAMKTTCFSHIIVHIKICQLTCCFLEILTQQGKNYRIKVSDGPNKSDLYVQDILVVQKCYLFVFCLKQPKDSLKEGSGLELLFIKVHPKEKCLPGIHDGKSLGQ